MSETHAVDHDLVDFDAVIAWMDERGLGAGPPINQRLLGGGTQNILVYFERGDRPFVLRRPPAHPRPNSNKIMQREARVLGALADSDVPHPRLIAASPEEDVIGVSFYLMEPIDGFNPTTGLPELHASDPTVRRAMGFEMVEGIAKLGRVDHVAVGLEDYGKPGGFLERQVERWRSQLESYSSFEGYPGPDIPGVEHVARWLDDNRPSDSRPGILHGDYHLANVMFSNTGPELAAIVDWELSTIGDPLLDLGQLVATWADDDGRAAATVGVTPWEGFPKASELVERYGTMSDRDLSGINWYTVLACYRLGIILEGTHARACAGKAPNDIGDLLHATTVGLFERALKWAV